MAVYKGDTQEEIDATDAYNMALQTLAESSVPLAAGGDFASTIRKNWPVGQMKFADGGYAREGYQVRGRVKPSAGATAAIEDAVALAKKLYEDAINAALQKYEHVGLRTVEEPITGKPANSRVWENDAPTQQQLEGVSATDANSGKVFNQHGLAEKDWSTGYYPGDYTYVLGSNSAELGVDAGEKILRDPVVLFGGRRDAMGFEPVPQQVIVDPVERAANLARFMENAKTPPVLYHASHADIPEFRNTKGSHFGFHFGDVEAANTRLEDTAGKFPFPKADLDERRAIMDAHAKNLYAYEDALRRKNAEVPVEELTRALEAGEDIGPIFKKYDYVPTPEEQAQLNQLRQIYEYSQTPIIQPGGVGANIGSYHVGITNPLRLPDVGNWGSVKGIKEHLPFDTDARTQAELLSELKGRGYDGIVYQNNVETPIMKTDSYIAFDPEQIKSAIGNAGTFDPTKTRVNEAHGGSVGYARGGYAEGGDPEIEKALRLAQEGSNPMEFVPNPREAQQPAPVDPTVDASGTGKWGRAFAALTGGRNLQNDVANVSSRLRPYEDYSKSFMDVLNESAELRQLASENMRSGEFGRILLGGAQVPLAYMSQAFAPVMGVTGAVAKTAKRFDPRAEVVANIMDYTFMPTPKVYTAIKIARDVLTAPAKMTARAVHTAEAVPGGGSGHLPGMAFKSLAERQAYTDAVRSALEDPGGRDVINKGVGLDAQPNKNTTGAWQPPTGPIEINPGFAAGSDVPLIYRDGNFVVDPEVEQALRTAATVRGGFTAQFGSAYNAQMVDRLGNNLAIDLPSRIKPDAMMNLIAKYGMDDFVTADTGSGANILNWGDRFSRKQAGDITQTLGGNLYARTREATNPNMNYVDLSNEWQAGAGSRQVTKRMINELTQLTPERLVSLDNPELANSAGKLLDVYVKEQAQGGQVRPDLMNMLQIVRDKGLKGLQAALGDPAQLLPALTAIGLAPSVYESATEDR